MVNIRDEIFKYQAINLNSLQEGENSLSENEKNSIILFNKAITNIKMGSEDIAIIELKKAIAINTNFIDAMVLLGLCYMEIRDYSKALDTLNRVLAVDSGNVRALEYCSIIRQKDPRLAMERKRSVNRTETADLSPSRTQSDTSRQIIERKKEAVGKASTDNSINSSLKGSSNSPLNSASGSGSSTLDNAIDSGSTVRNKSDVGSSRTYGSTSSNTNSNKYGGPSSSYSYSNSSKINYNLRKYMTGLVAGILIACLILVPALLRVKLKSNEVKAFKTEQDSVEAKSGTPSGEMEAANEKLNNQIKDLNKQIESQNSELSYYRNVSKLSQVRKLSQSGDYEAAADQLLALKSTTFNSPEKEDFDALSQDVFNKACYKVSNDGNELYNQKKYAEAITKLKKIEVYNPKFDYLNGALYVLGKCYQDSGDFKSAEATYRKVIASFPNTENARYAQMRIQEISSRIQ